MSTNPYEPPPETGPLDQPNRTCAGCWLRIGAYLIDVVPITLLTAAVFYLFLGFDETIQRRSSRAYDDIDARVEFCPSISRS